MKRERDPFLFVFFTCYVYTKNIYEGEKNLIVEVVLFLDMNKNALKALKIRLLGDKYEVRKL